MDFLQGLIYKLKKVIYLRIFKKDDMKLTINYCRKRGVTIGENMRAFSMPISAEPYLLKFGDNVTISGEVKFITHDNSVIKLFNESSNNQTDIFGEIVIGDNCFLGYRSLFLPGVTISDNTIVAAGSVVTKSFEQGNIVIGGNPARIISTTDEYKKKINKNCFDFNGFTKEEMKKDILNNKQKLLKK